MIKIIDTVWKICDQFIVDGHGKYVHLDEKGLERIAEEIKDTLGNLKDYWWGYPKCLKETDRHIIYETLYRLSEKTPWLALGMNQTMKLNL